MNSEFDDAGLMAPHRDLMVPLLFQTGQLVELARPPSRAGPPAEYLPVVFGTGAVLLAVAAYFILRHSRRREEEPVVGAAVSSQGTDLTAEQKRQLRRAMRRGDDREAARLLREVERYDEAARHFVRAEAWREAAECYAAAGEQTQAIHYFKRAGDRRRAAKLYAERGDLRSAAAEFAEAGEDELAAKYYSQADDHAHAARHYAAVGAHVEAANQYASAGSSREAARHYARAFLNRLKRADDDPDALGDASLRLAERSGRHFARSGEFDKAVGILRRAGRIDRVASQLVEEGEADLAADLLVASGDVQAAVSLLEQAGEQQRAYRTRAEHAYEIGEYERAARAFRRAGDLERAASLYDSTLGDSRRAAALYEEAERWLDAADAYEQAGATAEAARCAEKGGALVRASELYRDAGETEAEIRVRKSQGDYFRAGRLLLEQQQFERAIETLERINSRDPIYPRSLELQGDVYRASGHPDRANRRYREALDGRAPSDSTLGLYYKIARLAETREEWQDALECYDAIIRVDQSFADASSRRRTIQNGLGPSGEWEGTVETSVSNSVDDRIGAAGRSAGITNSGRAPKTDDELRYEFVEELARGGMGIVYRARDTFLNRIVAVKLLGEDLRDNETAVEYFLREARAVASLAHRNIVTIFDAGEQQGDYYIAMEYVDGKTLKESIEAGETFSEEETRRIMAQCCRALQYAHDHEIIHRDVKSDNIMRQPDGRVKVMDFGLAKFLREYQQEHTQQVGTPYYMSPEQITGENVEFRTDLYGLGCTAFECLTGRVPFTEGELAYHHAHTDPPSPKEFAPEISDEMEQIILRLLAKRPGERFESAQRLLEVLEGS